MCVCTIGGVYVCLHNEWCVCVFAQWMVCMCVCAMDGVCVRLTSLSEVTFGLNPVKQFSSFHTGQNNGTKRKKKGNTYG